MDQFYALLKSECKSTVGEKSSGISKEALNSIDSVLRGIPTAPTNEATIKAAINLKKFILSSRDQMIPEIVVREWTPLILNLLNGTNDLVVRSHALWTITFIAAGSSVGGSSVCTKELVKHNVATGLLPILSLTTSTDAEEISEHTKMLEQAIWVIGSLACESLASRDLILRSGVLPPLVKVLEEGASNSSNFTLKEFAF